MKTKKAFSIISIIATAISVIALIGGLSDADSAPKQCAAVAIALAIAIIPYCLLKAIAIYNQIDTLPLKTNILLEKMLVQLGSLDADQVTMEEIKTGERKKVTINEWIAFVNEGSNIKNYRRIRDDIAISTTPKASLKKDIKLDLSQERPITEEDIEKLSGK